MKLREAPEETCAPPPLQLRRWDCPLTRRQAGEQTGREVFGSRGKWLTARRRWRSTRGETLAGWWAAEAAAARAELRLLELLPLKPGPDREDSGW